MCDFAHVSVCSTGLQLDGDISFTSLLFALTKLQVLASLSRNTLFPILHFLHFVALNLPILFIFIRRQREARSAVAPMPPMTSFVSLRGFTPRCSGRVVLAAPASAPLRKVRLRRTWRQRAARPSTSASCPPRCSPRWDAPACRLSSSAEIRSNNNNYYCRNNHLISEYICKRCYA